MSAAVWVLNGLKRTSYLLFHIPATETMIKRSYHSVSSWVKKQSKQVLPWKFKSSIFWQLRCPSY